MLGCPFSGDAALAAHRVASAVGIPSANVHSGVKPSGKAALVRHLQEQGCRLLLSHLFQDTYMTTTTGMCG
jgi:cation transport ATPase